MKHVAKKLSLEDAMDTDEGDDGPLWSIDTITDVCNRTKEMCSLKSPDERHQWQDNINEEPKPSENDDERGTFEGEEPYSQEFLSTPDFITPVEDQFNVGLGDNNNISELSTPPDTTPIKERRRRSEHNKAVKTWKINDASQKSPAPPLLRLPSKILRQKDIRKSLIPPDSPRVPVSESSSREEISEGGSQQLEEIQGRIFPVMALDSPRNPPEPPLIPPKAPNLKRQISLHQRISIRKQVRSPPCLKNAFLSGETETPLKKRKILGKKSHGGAVASHNVYSHYRNEFKEFEELGHGNFSRVFRAQNRLDGCFYAIKRSLRPFRNEKEKAEALKEVQAMAAIGPHENIVQYFHSWCEVGYLFIQMEICEGSLAEMQKEKQNFDEKMVLSFIKQVSSALSLIHKKGIAHLDIKPDNIYHLSGNKFKIGDFGRAVKLDQLLGVEEGDIRYMPLEILNNDISDLTRVDVFSLGASAYELALNSPIPSSGDSFKAIREGNLAFLPSFSPAFQELLKSLMHPNPKLRPKAEEVMAHPLLCFPK